MAALRIPSATYRLQFNRNLDFARAGAALTYLQWLGITDLYTSPLFTARTGSAHGYDTTDPAQLNPELGGWEDFALLAGELRDRDMGLILDIVPNHMAADSQNPWWRDLLVKGCKSRYARLFDINWRPGRRSLTGKVLVPVLGEPYKKALENGQIKASLDEDGLWVHYAEKRFPLSLPSGNLSEGDLPDDLAEPGSGINREIAGINGIPGEPDSFDRLDHLLSGQHYRLSHWRTAGEEINYRRFFDVSDLVSLRMDREITFAKVHQLVLDLASMSKISGIRVDHVDGLHDPLAYLKKLQGRLRLAGVDCSTSPFYVIVEKILAPDEEIPDKWPVYGTTGYDFLNLVNGLFINSEGLSVLDGYYSELAGPLQEFPDIVYTQKKRIMRGLFAADLRDLVRRLDTLAWEDRAGHDLTSSQLEDALVELTACLGVYRTYINSTQVRTEDSQVIREASYGAAEKGIASPGTLDFLENVLLLKSGLKSHLRFTMRWQQFTGPVAAKGFEDTALYMYSRLLSSNEVGGTPHRPGISTGQFHHGNMVRAQSFPHTMNATTTHDTKRSEDVRARISVISDVPKAWCERVEKWRRWNNGSKTRVLGMEVPENDMEMHIYQTLAGAWPLNEDEAPSFTERMQQYLVKAARESKTHTGWLEPQPAYEDALKRFAGAILEPRAENPFLKDFVEFQEDVSRYGALNSLAQVLLKITAPGLPDLYQGTELWFFALVDPDNRRPVDFDRRQAMLEKIMTTEERDRKSLVRELLFYWKDGGIKLYLTYRALNFRKDNKELYEKGVYIPLPIKKDSCFTCAFARRLDCIWAITAAPLHLAARQENGAGRNGTLQPDSLLPSSQIWGDAAILLPDDAPPRWENVLTGDLLETQTHPGNLPGDRMTLPLSGLYRDFPVALLAGIYQEHNTTLKGGL